MSILGKFYILKWYVEKEETPAGSEERAAGMQSFHRPGTLRYGVFCTTLRRNNGKLWELYFDRYCTSEVEQLILL